MLAPHSRLWLPDDPTGTFVRNPLWAVLLFKLLPAADAVRLIALAEHHAAAYGWSRQRHRHHPTTDIAVETCPQLQGTLGPLVSQVVLPTLAEHYDFKLSELSIRDLFLVKYEADSGHEEQDRLAPHRDGNLLSFSILLSDPAEFGGGGLRFHSLGPLCAACDAKDRIARARCEECDGVGRLAVPGCGQGDLTTHCGKLLHEGARVRRGRRYVVVGFVNVSSPRIDTEFVDESVMANTSTLGAWVDHECVGSAMLDGDDEQGGAGVGEGDDGDDDSVGGGRRGVAGGGGAAMPRVSVPRFRKGVRGGDGDLADHLFGGM